MSVYLVMDAICDGDMVVAVFSKRTHASKWIKAHKDDPYTPDLKAKRYDSLYIVEEELDPK